MNWKLFSLSLGISILVMGGFFLYNTGNNINKIDVESNVCNSISELAHEVINNPDGSNTATILVTNKDGSNKSFSINNLVYSHGPVEIGRCNIYTIRQFGWNNKTFKPIKGEFTTDIWKYDYTGNGGKLLNLSEWRDDQERALVYYPYLFTISPDEKYISLAQGYLGSDKHALVIRDIDKEENVFILPIEKIIENNPERIGTIGLKEWTKDGKYFWIDIFNGANVSAFVRIERDAWSWEMFPAPENTMGGDRLNYNTGWVTHNTLGIWTGENEISQQIKEQYQKEGKTGVFALYNLFTKQEIVLETATDPTYFFKPKWISDTELEYFMPSGERKVYTIK